MKLVWKKLSSVSFLGSEVIHTLETFSESYISLMLSWPVLGSNNHNHGLPTWAVDMDMCFLRKQYDSKIFKTILWELWWVENSLQSVKYNKPVKYALCSMHFLHCNLNLCSNSANCVNSAPIGASALGTTMQRGPSGPAKNVENAFGKFSGNFFVKFFWKIFQFFFWCQIFFWRDYFREIFLGRFFSGRFNLTNTSLTWLGWKFLT